VEFRGVEMNRLKAHGMATQHLSIKEAVEEREEGAGDQVTDPYSQKGRKYQYVITAGIYCKIR
jgi:hypothetical protein